MLRISTFATNFIVFKVLALPLMVFAFTQNGLKFPKGSYFSALLYFYVLNLKLIGIF